MAADSGFKIGARVHLKDKGEGYEGIIRYRHLGLSARDSSSVVTVDSWGALRLPLVSGSVWSCLNGWGRTMAPCKGKPTSLVPKTVAFLFGRISLRYVV